jgi:hypothetical protein
MDSSSDNKGLVKYLILIILVLVAGYFLVSYFTKSQTEIYKFSGEIVSVEGNSVTLYGVFVGPIGTIPERLSTPRNFSFLVDETTTFNKRETFMPSWESINAAGTVTETGAIIGRYSSKDLVNLEGEGSLEDLVASIQRGAISVEVDFETSIHNSDDEVASHVSYHILVSPDLAPTQAQ